MIKKFYYFFTVLISGSLYCQNIGVNTDGLAPTELFHVKNTLASGSTILIEHTLGTQEPALKLLTPTANANWRLYIPASSAELRLSNGVSDRFTILSGGNVGIGTTVPAGRLDVKGSGSTGATYGFGVRNSLDAYSFTVDDAGAIRFPLIANGVVKTTGGTGTIAAGTVSLTTEVSGVLPLSNGGTNASLAAVNGGLVYSTGTALGITAAGTSTYVLISNGAAAPSWSARTMVNNTASAWRLFYSNAAGAVTELALPAAGQVLTSAGAAAAPVWSIGGTGSTILLYADETNSSGFANTANIKTYALAANTYTRIMFEADIQVSTTATGSNRVDFRFYINGAGGDVTTLAEGAPANGNFVSDAAVFKYSQAQTTAATLSINTTGIVGSPTWYVNSFRIYGIK